MALNTIANLDRRPPEAGRVRLGVKSGKSMKSIDTFRFTSQHQRIVLQLAELYGGTVKPWNDDGQRVRGQWEVITETSVIPIILPPDPLSLYFEQWRGGGCTRRCDATTVEIPGPEDVQEAPCICLAKQVLECRPTTRLNFFIPNIDLMGTFRLESHGEQCAKEMPGMVGMIQQLNAAGHSVRAVLTLEQRTSAGNTKRKHYVVPTLGIEATPDELLAGGGGLRPQLSSGQMGQLDAVVMGALVEPELTLDDMCFEFGFDDTQSDIFVQSVTERMADKPGELAGLLIKMKNRDVVPWFDDDNTLKWRVRKA